MSSGHQELSEESSEILPERPQKCRSMDRHRGQAAVLKQTSELIQTNESQRKQRQRVQRFPATGSEDRVISVRIMCASHGVEFQRKNHTQDASRGAVKNAVLSMLTGKTQAQSITGFAERTQGKLIFILLQLTVPKRLSMKESSAS